MNKILKIATFAAAVMIAAPATAGSTSLLNTVEYQTNSLDALPQWQRTLSKIGQEQKGYKACAKSASACGSKAMQAWQAMIKQQKGASQIDQLREVNSFINQWRYRADSNNYGKSDYWASPSEFFKRSGDCEDYAIAKYVTLRQMGFSADQLRLVVVKDVRRDLAHAVLAAYVGNDVFILDNLSSKVLPQSSVADYAPYYSVNEKARWAHAAAPASSNVASLSKAGGKLTAKSLFSKS
jgi:predicted transglutaminase-like cysteine proteinase